MERNAGTAIKIWRGLGFAWLIFIVCAYFWPSDALYAITIWPPFVWAGLGVALSLFGIRRNRNATQFVLIGSWMVFWLVFGEERTWIPSRLVSEPTNAFEIVSMNCSGGDIYAAREALASKPKIALLQESPGKEELTNLVKEIYGGDGAVLVGPDASIVVEGRFVPINLNFGPTNFTVGIVENDDLGTLLVVSLRLQPPVFRMDYWNPECWQAYAENRRSRRKELLEMAEYVKDLVPSRLIIGGDFNTPPDRGTFAPLDGWARSASDDSGYTAVNDFPMARIDQIWTKELTAVRSRADRTANSDHRIVRVWLSLPAKQE